MEELLEQFPKRTQEITVDYKSFLFQPERVSINSRISAQATSAAYLYQTQNFTRCGFKAAAGGRLSLRNQRASAPSQASTPAITAHQTDKPSRK